MKALDNRFYVKFMQLEIGLLHGLECNYGLIALVTFENVVIALGVY